MIELILQVAKETTTIPIVAALGDPVAAGMARPERNRIGISLDAGQNGNCQTLVSLILARGEVPVMVALRLFLARELDKQRASIEARPRTRRIPTATIQTGNCFLLRGTARSRPTCALGVC